MEPGGQFDFQQLLSAAAQMQSQIVSAQERLAEAKITGSAGGGLVTVTIDGQGELVDLTIAPDAIDQGDPQETAQTLADLVLAACRDAYRELGDVQEDMMGPLAGGLQDIGGATGIPGFTGIPGLTGQPPSGQPTAGRPAVPGSVEPGSAEPGSVEPGDPDASAGPGER